MKGWRLLCLLLFAFSKLKETILGDSQRVLKNANASSEPSGPLRNHTHTALADTYGAVSFLGGGGSPGEKDELGAVLLQPLHVGLQSLRGPVTAPGIHRDANGPGKLLVDASHLWKGGGDNIRARAKAARATLSLPQRNNSHQLEKGSKLRHHGDCRDSRENFII